jgi:large subunit ribosomal protein L22
MTTVKYIRVSPIKLRLVADLIRNSHVDRALAILDSIRSKKSASILTKSIKLAVNNLQAQKAIPQSKLTISRIEINAGPKLKRYMPRAKGVSYPIKKPTAHVVIELVELADSSKGGDK